MKLMEALAHSQSKAATALCFRAWPNLSFPDVLGPGPYSPMIVERMKEICGNIVTQPTQRDSSPMFPGVAQLVLPRHVWACNVLAHYRGPVLPWFDSNENRQPMFPSDAELVFSRMFRVLEALDHDVGPRPHADFDSKNVSPVLKYGNSKAIYLGIAFQVFNFTPHEGNDE